MHQRISRLRQLVLVGAALATSGCVSTAAAPDPPTRLSATRYDPNTRSDRDHDRLTDDRDACPDVPGVMPDGCPERDRDGDGFLDSIDACPDDPGVEPNGCPIPDTDRDRILDPDDACVDKHETWNGYEDADGCPDEIPKDLAAITGIIHGISFDRDKDTLLPASRPALARAIRVLDKYPQVRVEISGHTDNTRAPAYGKNPSANRAAYVKRYLVEHGVDGARIETRGPGPDEPIDTNETPQGRARNNRVEFTILVQ